MPAGTPVAAAIASPLEDPGFKGRGSMRRRARFLRKARELAYRDLGGLVYNLHRFGQRNDVLVIAKLTTLSHIDTELRTLEAALEERHPITILREAGVAACPRCAAIHSGDDRFCPNCGLSMSRRVDLPVAAPPAPASPAPAAQPQAAAPAPAATGTGTGGALPSPGPLPGPAPGAGPGPPASTVRPPSPAAVPGSPDPAGGAPGGLPGESPNAPADALPTPAKESAAPVQAPPSAPGGDQPTEVLRPPARGA